MTAWRNGDVVSGLILAALGAFIVRQAWGWDYLTPDGPGAGFFPRWYGMAMVVLSLMLVVRGMRQRAPPTPNAHGASTRRVLACWAALVVCVLLVQPLGFPVSFALLGWFVATMLFGKRQRVAVPFSLAAAAAFWLVFDVGLDVALPRGLWGA
ncbi:MAG TPA: tripartite tricarboxylate transporter TctB family protein [Casimicrobiaceae bacterium]